MAAISTGSIHRIGRSAPSRLPRVSRPEGVMRESRLVMVDLSGVRPTGQRRSQQERPPVGGLM